MSLSVTSSLWPRHIAANTPSQDLADLSTKPHVEGLNFPVHLEHIQMISDYTRQKIVKKLFFKVTIDTRTTK
ncbi:hypothetical protein ES705_21048 [subsurface metagenome]|jgi:hypothetical protein